MAQFKPMLRWQTISGDKVTVGDITLTPQSQAARRLKSRLERLRLGVGVGRRGGPPAPTQVGARRHAPQTRLPVAALGRNYGIGGGVGPKPTEGQAMSEDAPQGTSEQPTGFGSGGGGGGASMARPVAVISVGPEGVQIQPVVDAAKIALAFFTTIGSMFFMLARMRRAGRG